MNTQKKPGLSLPERLGLSAGAFTATALVIFGSEAIHQNADEIKSQVQIALEPESPSHDLATQLYSMWEAGLKEGETICEEQTIYTQGSKLKNHSQSLQRHMEELTGVEVQAYTWMLCDQGDQEIYDEQLGFRFGSFLNPTTCVFNRLRHGEGEQTYHHQWICSAPWGGSRLEETLHLTGQPVLKKTPEFEMGLVVSQ